MNYTGLSLAQNSGILPVIRAVIKSLYAVSYGYIEEVLSATEILVTFSVNQGGGNRTVPAKFTSLTGELFELNVTPHKGDHVLLLHPKDIAPLMYTASSGVQGGDGYKECGCLALQIGTIKAASYNSAAVTDTDVTVGIGNTTKDAGGNDVEHAVNLVKTVSGNETETTKGNRVFTAAGMEFNGSDDNLMRYSELNTALQKFVTDLSTCMTSTPIIGEGSTQSWVNFPQLDISKCLCASLKTGTTDPST